MDDNWNTRFFYSERDFNFQTAGKNEESFFDQCLKDRWKQIEDDENILRYSVRSQKSKQLEGKYGFMLELNMDRAIKRRKPEAIMSINQPFDGNKFNFTKISNKEILFDIGNGDGNDVIIVNVSPILWSHSLMITERFHEHPQHVTLYSIKKSLDIILLSKTENLKVLFNSLCANASVNHLHWHLYYLNSRMLLEHIELQYFTGCLYILENFPAKGFCIQLSSFDQDLKRYTSYLYKIVLILKTNEIPYNIYITRAKTNVTNQVFNDIRTYIWARESCYGVKDTENLLIAACECFGHMNIRNEKAYEEITEDDLCQALSDATSNALFLAKEKLNIEEISSVKPFELIE
ncbi:hypothetical protein TKK_0005780 [Trichogramma kaykai]|uniref:GDP-D-glucose phosphorylase 1 n=1 Tax=Trichogramma kaykai TaxID=54128 RepID=A0ABD2XHW2_9HYME